MSLYATDLSTFSIYRGRTRPVVRMTVIGADGKALTEEQLQGATFTVSMRHENAAPADSLTFSAVADFTVSGYNVSCTFDAGDTDIEPGIYIGHLNITWPDGGTQAWPPGKFRMRVEAPVDYDGS